MILGSEIQWYEFFDYGKVCTSSSSFSLSSVRPAMSGNFSSFSVSRRSSAARESILSRFLKMFTVKGRDGGAFSRVKTDVFSGKSQLLA